MKTKRMLTVLISLGALLGIGALSGAGPLAGLDAAFSGRLWFVGGTFALLLAVGVAELVRLPRYEVRPPRPPRRRVAALRPSGRDFLEKAA